MVPFYEEAMEENGFQNATSAISAALKDNEVPVVNINTNANEKQSAEVVVAKEEAETYLPQETEENVEMEQDPPSVQEDESINEYNAVTDPSGNKTEVSPQKEEVHSSPPKECEKEEAVADNNNKDKENSPAQLVQPKVRKSNIRTSWDSPSGSQPVFKRNPLRRSCNK